MNPLVFTPDSRLKTKFYTIVLLIGVLSIVSMVAFIVLIAIDEGVTDAFGLAVGVGLAVNLLWIVPIMLGIGPYCDRMRFEVHDDEVIVHVGLVTKSIKHVPFRTVTNLQLNRGPFDRMFGIGTLNIQTAGMSGQKGAEESLMGLNNVQEVYELAAKALRRYRSALAPDQAGEELVQAADGAAMNDVLVELRAIRAALERQDH